MTKTTSRTFQTEKDYWRIRAFFRAVHLASGGFTETCWQVARLDYWRWHVLLNCEQGLAPEDSITLWESAGGEIVAVLNTEGWGEAYLQIHPTWKTAALETEMLELAEEKLAHTEPEGRTLTVWSSERDELLQNLLHGRGYRKQGQPDHQRQITLDRPLPEAHPAAGYTIRPLGGVEELPARSWVSWRAFHPDAPDEEYEGWEWYYNIQRQPLYRRDLDIVAVAPAGAVVGFCTLWYDDVTRTGYFEPVGVMPEHQQRGLGKAVMVEALRRFRWMGGQLATVGGFSPAANALYASVMGPEKILLQPWVKVF